MQHPPPQRAPDHALAERRYGIDEFGIAMQTHRVRQSDGESEECPSV